MENATTRTVFRKDYRPPDYRIDEVDLRFELGEEATTVRSRLKLHRISDEVGCPLVLDGKDLELVSIALDGKSLDSGSYRLGDDDLTVEPPAADFSLEVVTRIKPQENTLLEGLYKSGGNFCTQCEAEGFRRITYYLDRPDVMARFTTTIVADRERYPVLLSNGNEIEAGQSDDGRHWSRWADPFPKPSYLFALVAGDLAHIEDHFTTRSGRPVQLRIYAADTDIDKCAFAMAALKNAMAWDERVFGLEYDLDIYNIVAISDFNMGAMENKGLNIFNTQLVLARPETATDDDFARIESVIGHEYFHNWTGNRVTCRDWFQLSLKEGLTVFRDQQFSADMSTSPVNRIEDVKALRGRQFLEDAGPLAHPVRPDSYIEINNFYTGTVYDKGAEVIRMMHTLLGADGFRKGIDLYFERHDGEAVTCEDFVRAMEDANHADLGQFRLWYSQAGTPELTVDGDFDAEAGAFTLTVHQSCAPTPGQAQKDPMHIPLRIGLLDEDGRELPLVLEGEETGAEAPRTRVLDLRAATEEFRFVGIERKPVPSVLRGFSAPVRLGHGYSRDDLLFLMSHDRDPFCRWEAGQTLASQVILALVDDYRNDRVPEIDDEYLTAVAGIVTGGHTDRAHKAEMLTLPQETYISQLVAEIDPRAIHQARSFIRGRIAEKLTAEFLDLYKANTTNEPYSHSPEAIGRRRLRNICLSYLMYGGGGEALELCMGQFRNSSHMTDTLASLRCLAQTDFPERSEALGIFYDRWRDDPLVVDKWFAIQATSERSDTLDEVMALTGHPAFDLRNPNKLRALIGAFSMANPARFHDSSGAGYRFFADRIIELDKLNPRTAARLMAALERWRGYEPGRRRLMKAELERILAEPGLSTDVWEIATKSLERSPA